MRLAAIILLGAALAAPAGPLSADEDELGGIPRAPGAEETYYSCAACHSIRLVTQQGLSRQSWEETLDWMVEEQEMEPIDEPDRQIIVDYLTKYYGIDRLARTQTAAEK